MYVLIMVYILSQKTATVVVDFNSKLACEQAGALIRTQIYEREGRYPDAYVCAHKGA